MNSSEVRSKSFMSPNTRAFSHATGSKSIEEFAYSPERARRQKSMATEAED